MRARAAPTARLGAGPTVTLAPEAPKRLPWPTGATYSGSVSALHSHTKGARGLMTTRPTVSVVICCYTEQRWLDVCAAIDSITAQMTAV